MAYDTILTETKGAVGIATLNRPKALNALNAQLIDEMNRPGVVARVVPAADLMREAAAQAEKIAGFSSPAVIAVKRTINEALETPSPTA